MSTPELEQAIAAARFRGIEKDVTEVLSRMLNVPPEVVARVVYAWETISDKRLVKPFDDQQQDLFGELEHGGDIPDDVRNAIDHNLARAFRRIAIRWRMERGIPLEVPFDKLVPESEPSKICNGCTWRLECVRDLLSTPARCLGGAVTYGKDQPKPERPSRMFQHLLATVTPIKLEDAVVTVTAEHPQGTYVVNVLDVRV
jgi:hypothetical protein